MMAAVAARELSDGEVVFVGIGLPNLACNLARATHAPNLVLIYESGAVGAVPARLPVSIGDPALVTGSLMVCGMADVFQLFLQNGRIEVGFLGGAQVDRYGNINTTVIGPYERPTVRLPGSGGAAEIAVHARRTLIVAKLNPRAFPERVDFVTSPGQRCAGRGRRELGMPAIWSAAAMPAVAQREPVLKQVGVPHAYYWREMYVPQVTSGPSAVTWSPDGTELIYSMQGSLWRQRIGSRVARQLATGEGYDYQPDWSPDGRLVVFARYAHDAIELQLLDLASGSVRPVTANGAVNVEPRWSPDGRRIAFVSSAYNRRWHIFTVAVDAGAVVEGTVTRLTEDNDSRLPRYYYSVWDHYLSPTWSPDGRELIVVANRGHIHGTGGFWRMTATPGAPIRELRYEETTWKARPDWSPDASRVVYSSYLGRQWHQLWLMTSEGGDALPLTYGEFDATAPRWSRDARHIAYISNEGGNTALWVIDVPGAQRRQIVASERRYRDSVGRLRLVVVDAVGRPLPARVSVSGIDGRAYAPDDAWRHADEAFDRRDGTNRGFEYGYFHTTGTAELTVPTGAVQVEVWHGPEYRVARADVTVPAGRTLTKRLVLERLANLPARGWWSGDLHVHMNYGGAYRNTPAHLAFQGRAEDLHVVENLIVNKEQRSPDIAYFRTDADPVSTPTFLLLHAQEFHTSVWGHVGLLRLS